MKLEFFRQVFEKYSSTAFHENPFNGSRVVPCGQKDGLTDRKTDRHEEGNSDISQLYKGA